MFKKTGARSAIYELQPIPEGNSSEFSMSKTHSRQKSYVPITMIDEEITSCDIAVVGQVHGGYSNDQAFITVESSPSEKTPSTLLSPQTTSLQSSNNNLIKTRNSKNRKGSVCCKVCWILISLIFLVVFIAAGIYYWQVHSHSESGHFETGLESRAENEAYTLPQGRENVTTTKIPSRTKPTVPTSRTTSDNSAIWRKPTKVSKSLDGNMDRGKNYVISPLGFDYSMSVFGNISSDVTVVSNGYFEESQSRFPQIYSSLKNLINESTNVEHGHNALRIYGNGEVSDDIIYSTNIVVDESDNVPLIYISNYDYNSLPENADFISKEFNDKTELGYLNNLGGYLRNPEWSFFGVNTFNFAMRFKKHLNLVDHNVSFHTKNGEIKIKKYISFVNGTFQSLRRNTAVMITLPLEDDRFHFFICMGHRENFMTELPSLDTNELADNLRISAPIQKLKVAIPHFEITSINNFNKTLVDARLTDICVNFPSTTSRTCLQLTDIVQGVHFRISASGINIPNESKNNMRTGFFKDYKTVINVDRPFYFGIWFQDPNLKMDGFVYFGAYLGPSPSRRLI